MLQSESARPAPGPPPIGAWHAIDLRLQPSAAGQANHAHQVNLIKMDSSAVDRHAIDHRPSAMTFGERPAAVCTTGIDYVYVLYTNW
jgi:hypothetical protein